MLQPCNFALRKNVKGFPWYSVDNNGECRSLERHAPLSYSRTKTGYTSVRFCKKIGKEKIHTRFLLHRLMLSSFCGINPNKNIVDHIDNNPKNNILINLRWVTQSENVKKAFDLGRAIAPKATLGKFGALHHSSLPLAGYDDNGNEVVRFESIGLARAAGYFPDKRRSYKSKGLTFKYL